MSNNPYIKILEKLKKSEEWKYSPVLKVFQPELKPYTQNEGISVTHTDIAEISINIDDCYKVVTVNGFYSEDLSDVCEHIYVRTVEPQVVNNSNLEEFQKSLFQEEVGIHIPSGVVLDKPVHLLHIQDMKGTGLTTGRILISLDSQAEVHVIEQVIHTEAVSSVAQISTEISLGENAHLTYEATEHETKGITLHSLKIIQERDSSSTFFSSQTGGEYLRYDKDIHLNGEGSTTNLSGLYALSEKSIIENHVHLHHEAPHTTSSAVYKGVVGDQSKGVFHSKAYITKDAPKVEAHQLNKNLLLSEEAHVDTKPELEVYTDDVQCSHGATVGHFDVDALSYMRSRGIDETRAKQLMIQAFVEEILLAASPEVLKFEREKLKKYLRLDY